MLRGLGARMWRFPPNQLWAQVLSLFTNGEPGWLFDNSRADTLFSDLAGTVPAVLDGPIGRQTSLAGTAGIYRTTTATANRPTWSGRYNLRTQTEDVSAAAWAKGGVTASGVNFLVEAAATSGHYAYQSGTSAASTNYTTRVDVAPSTRRYVVVSFLSGAATAAWVAVVVDTQTGAITQTSQGASGTYVSSSIAATADGWWTVTFKGSIGANADGYTQVAGSDVPTPSLGGFSIYSYAGDGVKGFYVRKIDCRPTDQTVTLPAYQWVTTGSGAGTYDVNGFPLYIRPNGSSQFLYIPSLTLGVSTMFLSMGIRRLSDAAAGMIVESSAASSNAGAFNLFTGASAKFVFSNSGNVVNVSSAGTYPAPATCVASGLGNPAGNQTTVRVNGVATTDSSAAGTTPFATYPVYFFMRAGASLPFSGFETCSIGRAASSLPSAAQIASTEQWVNSRTRAY